jgi:peptidoglycan/xylan/chitin deacetylase (PgdA/CDA1 family)
MAQSHGFGLCSQGVRKGNDMLKYTSRVSLEVLFQQLAKVPLARRLMHDVSVLARGPCVVFLRCHRLLPDDDKGRLHHHTLDGLSMTPGQLAKALEPIQKHLPIVHMAEAVEMLLSGKRLKHSFAVLSFDESYKTTAELAAPLCQSLHIPACFFVTTYHAGHATSLWHDQIHCLLEDVAPNPVSLPWMDRVLKTYSGQNRKESSQRLLRHLTRYSEAQRKRRFKELLAIRTVPQVKTQHDEMLSLKDISRFKANSYFSFASHGHQHLPLASLEPHLLEQELAKPREILRKCATSSYVDVISYPFGYSENINHEVTSLAQTIGYRAAFTSIKGVARPGDHMFTLPRLSISSPTNLLHAYELQSLSRAIDELLLVALDDKRVAH